MKKGFIIIALFFVLIIGTCIKVYMDAVGDYHQYEQAYTQLINQETNLRVVNYERYHGDQLVHVLTAEDADGERYFVFIDDGAETIRESDIVSWKNIQISESEVQQHVYSRTEQAKILRMIPARIADRPAWEVAVKEDNDTLHYVYVDMQTGDELKAYILPSTGNQ